MAEPENSPDADESAGADESADAAPAPAPAAGETMLRGRFAIFIGSPLPDLDSPSAKAYLAEDRRDPLNLVFALICSSTLPVRTESMAEIKGFETRGLLTLIEWGTVYWPPSGANVMTVIYERPLGGRVTAALAHGKMRISEYEMPRRIIQPVAAALSTLDSLGLLHRAVRPDNLFFTDEERQNAVIGEFVTSPPGYDQPVVCETIERGMCSQAGRGLGNSSDDVYALGATLIILLLGHNPLQRMTMEELLETKVEQGSYAALCGTTRVPMSLLEPLKGMLSDDPYERWTYAQIQFWIDGKKATPMQKRAAPRAATPYVFSGHDINTPRMMAYHFARHVPAAAKALRSDPHLENFLRRSLGDTGLADRLRLTVGQAKVYERTPMGSDDALVSKACMTLDPQGPIRYKGAAFMADGFGPALASEIITKGSGQAMAEMLARELHDAWYAGQPRGEADLLTAHKALSRCKAHLKINDPGHGVERCLYDMNPGLACQSPLLANYNAAEADELLGALDKIAADADAQTRPMDRHIAAFIAARYADDIHPHLRAMASKDDAIVVIGILSFYAFLQWKLRRAEALYGLAGWLGGLLGPALNTYNSRKMRKEIERQIPSAVRRGNLPEMFEMLDNAERRRADNEGFAKAQAEWAAAAAEISEIEGETGDRMESSLNKGRQLAAAAAVMISTAAVCAIFLAKVF